MFFELIATLVAGIAAAGIVFVINRSLKGRLPRWLMPVAAGFAMLAATISNEYGWFPRQQDNMPAEFVIAESVEATAFYRPWTYLFPFVERFVAVDTATISRHPAVPERRIAEIFLYSRWSPVKSLGVLADCEALRRAPITEAVQMNDDGSVEGVKWSTVPATDPILKTICEAS